MSDLPPPPDERRPAAPAPVARARRRWVWRWVVAAVGLLVVAATVFAAVARDDDAADPSVSDVVSPTTSRAPPNAPARLRAIPGAFQVKLTWDTGAGDGAPVAVYEIERDHHFQAEVDAMTASWIDDDAVPGQRYTYELIAVSEDGATASASVLTTTRSAPPGTATLIGTFNVKLHATSHSGFQTFGPERYSSGWRFKPQCAHPPCATQLRDIHDEDIAVSLQQTGGTYRGSDTASFGTCNGHRVTSSLTITLHVTRAGEVHGEWRVTKLAGEMTEYTSAQLGCVSTSARFELVGSALKQQR